MKNLILLLAIAALASCNSVKCPISSAIGEQQGNHLQEWTWNGDTPSLKQRTAHYKHKKRPSLLTRIQESVLR